MCESHLDIQSIVDSTISFECCFHIVRILIKRFSDSEDSRVAFSKPGQWQFRYSETLLKSWQVGKLE